LPKTYRCNGLEIVHTFPNVGEKALQFSACKVVRKSYSEDIILLAIQDVTEHRRAQQMIEEREEWMRNMANNAPVMMWVAGTDKLNTFVNKSYLDFRGIKLEHAVGKLWTENVHPDDLEKCLKTYESHFDQKQPYTLEYRLLRQDGVYRWILDKAKPNFKPDGQFTGFIGSCIEIHDQRMGQLELEKKVMERTRELIDTNTELERSHSELQQFAYVASHDLQEPLRKILTFVDRIEEGYADHLNDDIKRYFSKVHDASQNMTRLLDDLLNFSRISRLNKRYIKTDLNEILQNVLSDLESDIQEKGAQVTVETLPVIQAIPLQVAQLFHQLLNNAVKFSRPGDEQPQIKVWSKTLSNEEKAAHVQLDPALPYCEIIIQDNGIGFSPEYAEQIFGVFQRLNDKGQFTGTGIGLSVCRKIVSNHNGLIYATGKEDDGATFHVLLPLQQNL
jgi:PAS domain S-box-containing protein